MRARVSVMAVTTLVAACFFAACSSSSSSTSGSPDSGTSTDDGGGGSTDGASTNDAAPSGDGGDQQLPGNLTTPTSCTAVCTAAGLTCDPTYDWQQDLNDTTDGKAGGQLEYHDPTDGYAFYGIDCTTVPATTKDLSGSGNPSELGTLTEFDCACK